VVNVNFTYRADLQYRVQSTVQYSTVQYSTVQYSTEYTVQSLQIIISGRFGSFGSYEISLSLLVIAVYRGSEAVGA